MNNQLDELKRKRLKYVDGSKENGFDEGIKHLLTDLYPDNAHFIYELLQNAEDPEATEVTFTLTETEIEFEHNGKRLFTLKDVESITSIGTSTKADDDTSIGKFGVGFKAVFAYTNSPEIYSGNFDFHIHDLVVPSQEGIVRPNMDANKTRFVFPFNHPKKMPEKAVKEIEHSLLNLGDNTLLFLNHIKKIEFICPFGGFGSLERFDHEYGHIEIITNHINGDVNSSHWLHFKKDVEVNGEDGKNHLCSIAIAYKLKEVSNKKSSAPKWKITPLDHGQVSIFFPAEKETSNLKFHVHAPFASTVARDSVRDCEENHQLRDHIAELVAESLESIREKGLLDVSFLAVLPNPADNLSAFYEPIRKKLIHAFQTQNLTPTKQGLKHFPALKLYRGPAVISKTLSDNDMTFFLGGDIQPPIWVANAPQENQREDRFFKSLNIKQWGWSELAEAICDFNELEENEKLAIEKWLYKQNDSWIQKFYALLGEACYSNGKCFDVDDLKIIRIETDSGDTMVNPSMAFLPLNDKELTFPKGVDFVKQAVFNLGKSKQRKIYARSFLEEAGIATYDEHQQIKELLDKYSVERKKLGKKRHLEEISQIQSYWINYPNKIEMLKDKFLMMSENQNLDQKFFQPFDCYLDSPFEETGLSALFNSTDIKLKKIKHPILKDYSEISGFTGFAKAIGVMSGFEVCEGYATKIQEELFPKVKRKTETTIDYDFYINGLGWGRKGSNLFLGFIDIDSKEVELSFLFGRRFVS